MGASLLAAALWFLAPRAAPAAFEVRDASPMALGAVSMDLDAAAERPDAAPGRAGFQLGASHASLFHVESLTAEQAWIGWMGGGADATLSLSQVGLPGAREFRALASLEERGRRSALLSVAVERLQLELEGEPAAAGWTLGCGAQAARPIAGARIEVSIRADRVYRTQGLDRLAVVPSVPVSFRVRSGPATAAWVDRWESDGRRSPRIVIDLAPADAIRIRLARGGRPDRVGAALAVRWRHLEISAGRLDVAQGGTVSAAALRVVPALARKRP